MHPDVAGTSTERNRACESCHAEIAAEWRASLHRQSVTDDVYQRAFAREPLAFCTGCHAPEGAPGAIAATEEAAALGTACVTCHSVAGGEVRTRSCEGCHEFGFPEGPGKMQLTVTEHRASIHASTSCASCHMTRSAGHANHRFASSRDPEMLRRAAIVTASRHADGVVVTFTPRDAGHAFPTGDIFRRLRVTAAVCGDASSRTSTHLGRHSKGGEERDDRPFARGTLSEVKLPIVAPGRPIEWRVSYERVEHPLSADEAAAVIAGAVDVAGGVLEPEHAGQSRRRRGSADGPRSSGRDSVLSGSYCSVPFGSIQTTSQ